MFSVKADPQFIENQVNECVLVQINPNIASIKGTEEPGASNFHARLQSKAIKVGENRIE